MLLRDVSGGVLGDLVVFPIREIFCPRGDHSCGGCVAECGEEGREDEGVEHFVAVVVVVADDEDGFVVCGVDVGVVWRWQVRFFLRRLDILWEQRKCV